MITLYPLRFHPVFKRYIWGGHRLRTLLNKPLEPDETCAESWEICDHGEDQSVVQAGPLAGKTLHELVGECGAELLGEPWLRHGPSLLTDRFPLILKFLDAECNLSVQVHPNDQMAARLNPPEPGKTEAWVVLAAEPGSVIYAGLMHGVDREMLAEAIQEGNPQRCLHCFDARPGDCVFIPAGTVHALGEGILVAEIQQAGNTTFRLFDWNRLGSDGQPRPLHVEQGLEAIDFQIGPVLPIRHPEKTPNRAVSKVDCPQFILDGWVLSAPVVIGSRQQFHILCVLDGSLSIEGDPAEKPLQHGQTALLPAAIGPRRLTPHRTTTLLDAYLPA